MKYRGPTAVFALGVILGAAIGAFTGTRVAAQNQPPVVSVQRPGMGRYEIVISPHVARDTFLLDTQTGKTWTPIKYTDLEGEPVVWQFRDRVDDEAQFQKWWHSFTPKKADK